MLFAERQLRNCFGSFVAGGLRTTPFKVLCVCVCVFSYACKEPALEDPPCTSLVLHFLDAAARHTTHDTGRACRLCTSFDLVRMVAVAQLSKHSPGCCLRRRRKPENEERPGGTSRSLGPSGAQWGRAGPGCLGLESAPVGSELLFSFARCHRGGPGSEAAETGAAGQREHDLPSSPPISL